MPIKPDTFWGVCNTTLSIPDKYLINTYLLNPIPGKDWIVCVGACCIRHTNTHDHWQMIDPPDTCLGVCNTPLPIRIKNLIPLWTMNLKLGTCWGVCNTPLPIRIKNLIPLWTMNLKPGTCWSVCNTPLPIRIKNLIPLWTMNLKPDTCWGVCNTPLPIRNKYLVNTYLLNLIPDKDWMVRVGAYCIRLTNAHDHGQIIDPSGTCWGVCNTPLPIRNKYLINTYLLNPILEKDWIVRVGAYCIRPTNAHDHGQMIDPPDTFRGVCNTPLPIRIKNLIPIYWMNLKLGRFLGVCLCGQLHLGGKPLKFV